MRDVEIIDYASAAKRTRPPAPGASSRSSLAQARQPGTSKPVGELGGARETRGAALGEPVPVQVHSVRMPSFVLSCEAIFGAPDERLVIRHDAAPPPLLTSPHAARGAEGVGVRGRAARAGTMC